MLVYSFTYFINAFGHYFNKQSRKIMTVIVICLLAFISGTRYYMGGSDVLVYEGVYNTAPSIWATIKAIFENVEIHRGYENGFILICSVFKTLNFTYFGFTFAYAILFYLLMYFGLKRYVEDWAIFIAVFMYKIFFYNTFISIRQGLTLAIFCFSIRFIEEKKPWKYFLLCLLAYTCHRAALVTFPLYFINKIPLTKKVVAWSMTLFAPTWFFKDTFDISGLIVKIGEFLGSNKGEAWAEPTQKISILHTIECYVVLAVILYFFDIIEKDDKLKMFTRMLLLLLPMFTIGSNWIIFTRIKDYFVLFYGLILGSIAVRSPKKTIGSYISFVVFAACFIGMIRYVLVFDGGVLKEFESFIFKGENIFTWF